MGQQDSFSQCLHGYHIEKEIELFIRSFKGRKEDQCIANNTVDSISQYEPENEDVGLCFQF